MLRIIKISSHTKESLLIGNNVGSSVSKPAATIGIMAVKILFTEANRKGVVVTQQGGVEREIQS